MKLSWMLIGLLVPVVAFANPDFVKVKGYELEYEMVGSGSDVILLEAGGSAGMSDWDPVFQRLSEHAKVIRYSRVGNGNSTVIQQHFTSRDYADQASILLRELGIQQPVILIAHSYGGSVARDFAAAFPQGKSVLTENSGHFVQFDEPELVVSELLLLMKRLEEGALPE